MLFASAHVRVEADHGTATLWLNFPGDPVNALDSARLRELAAALDAVAKNPFVNILVVRSGKPAGFCAGIHPAALTSLEHPANRAAFAWHGQQVFARLAALPFTTVAFIDGPCLGVGLELALMCDHRLCVARPTTHLGFPDLPPCFGGTGRVTQLLGRRATAFLASGQTLSGREARDLGLVDHAFCERRAKIELRTFLDRLERKPRLPNRGEATSLAAERRAFATCNPRRITSWFNTFTRTVPPVIGLVGENEADAHAVAEAVLRGSRAVVLGTGAAVFARIDVALARGFVTPLEAEQARGRITLTDSVADLRRVRVVLGKPITPASIRAAA